MQTEKQNPAPYEQFRKLLWKAIGPRTQAQFASEAGLSAEHLNRLLNAAHIRPSFRSMEKITAVSCGAVTLQDLLDALDKDGVSVAPKKPAAAPRNMKTLAGNVIRAMKDTLSRFRHGEGPRQTFGSVYKAMEDISTSIAARYREMDAISPMPDLSFSIGQTWRYPEHLCGWVPDGIDRSDMKYTAVDISMADDLVTIETTAILYFTEDGGEIRLVDVKMDYVALFELFGAPCACVGTAPEDTLNGVEEYLLPESGDPIRAANVEPEDVIGGMIPFRICPLRKFYTRGLPDDAKTQEERIMYSLFGKDTRYPVAIYGLGFNLTSVPDGLARFLRIHAKSLLSLCPEHPEPDEGPSRSEVSGKIDELLSGHAAKDDIAAALDGLGIRDMHSLETGWRAAVAGVMSEETSWRFVAYRPQPDKDPDTGVPLTEGAAVLFARSDMKEKNVSNHAALNVIARYASELGVSSIRHMLYRTMETENLKLDTYRVRPYQEPGDREPVVIDPARLVRFDPSDPSTYPGGSGLYRFLLKDGRFRSIVVTPRAPLSGNAAPGDVLFLSCYREWSDMIDSYDPVPIKTMTKDGNLIPVGPADEA